MQTRTQLVDGPAKTAAGALLIKCSGVWNRSSSTMGIRKFQGKTTHRTSARCEWILSRKIGGL